LSHDGMMGLFPHEPRFTQRLNRFRVWNTLPNDPDPINTQEFSNPGGMAGVQMSGGLLKGTLDVGLLVTVETESRETRSSNTPSESS
jgi:hypothetical protein